MTTEANNALSELALSLHISDGEIVKIVQTVLEEIDRKPYPDGLEKYLGKVTMPGRRTLHSMVTSDDDDLARECGWGPETVQNFNILFTKEILPRIVKR